MMITLRYPYLILLLPLPLLIRYLIKSNSVEKGLAVPFLDHYAPYAKVLEPKLKLTWRTGLYYGSWICLVFALMRPVYFGAFMPQIQKGRNILFALDISNSMQNADQIFEHQRIQRIDLVKKVAKQFIQQRQGDRVGLILFGSRAFLQAPLSFDLQTVNALLEEASVGIAGSYTAMGDAIALATKRFKDLPNDQRILILLTDGAANAGQLTPIQAAQLARDHHVKIYCIGLSSTSLPVSAFFSGSFFNGVNDLDLPTLKKIATLTGGQFFEANDNRGLKEIYDKINQLEPIQKNIQMYRIKTEYYHVPLLIAWLFSAILYTVYCLEPVFKN